MLISLTFFTYALWSSVFSLGKMALVTSTPLFVTAIRMLLAGLLIITFLFFRNRQALKIKKIYLLPLLLLALLGMYLPNAFEFWALGRITAAKTCFLYSISPFFGALFSYLHFKEKMNRRKWIGMLIGFLGMFPVFLAKPAGEVQLGGIGFFSWPELAVMTAALCSIYGWVLLRLMVKDNKISPLTVNGWCMLFGGAMALLHSYFADSWLPVPISKGGIWPFTQAILIITFISNIICYNLYGFLLKRMTATFLSFAGLLSPIFASLTGWILLGEAPSPTLLLSSGIVICGLWIVYKEELRQGYMKPRTKALEN